MSTRIRVHFGPVSPYCGLLCDCDSAVFLRYPPELLDRIPSSKCFRGRDAVATKRLAFLSASLIIPIFTFKSRSSYRLIHYLDIWFILFVILMFGLPSDSSENNFDIINDNRLIKFQSTQYLTFLGKLLVISKFCFLKCAR